MMKNSASLNNGIAVGVQRAKSLLANVSIDSSPVAQRAFMGANDAGLSAKAGRDLTVLFICWVVSYIAIAWLWLDLDSQLRSSLFKDRDFVHLQDESSAAQLCQSGSADLIDFAPLWVFLVFALWFCYWVFAARLWNSYLTFKALFYGQLMQIAICLMDWSDIVRFSSRLIGFIPAPTSDTSMMNALVAHEASIFSYPLIGFWVLFSIPVLIFGFLVFTQHRPMLMLLGLLVLIGLAAYRFVVPTIEYPASGFRLFLTNCWPYER